MVLDKMKIYMDTSFAPFSCSHYMFAFQKKFDLESYLLFQVYFALQANIGSKPDLFFFQVYCTLSWFSPKSDWQSTDLRIV